MSKSKQIVDNLKSHTEKSQKLQAPAQSITIINGPLLIVGQGPFPQIIKGLTDLVETGTQHISQMQGMDPIAAGTESDNIFDAFREFVRVHGQFLNIMIGKAGLFNTVPFIGQPVAAVLRQVENIIDTISFALIDAVQFRSSDLQSQAEHLNKTIETAISSYDGLAIQ